MTSLNISLFILLVPFLVEGNYFDGSQTIYQTPATNAGFNPVLNATKQTNGKATYPASTCKHHLSGVSDEALVSAIAHQASVIANDVSGNSQLGLLQHQKVFIAACLRNAEKVMLHWTAELIRLVMALKGSGNGKNIFVSIYESGSIDHTTDYLDSLRGHLTYLEIPNKIVQGGVTRNGRQRIPFLADVRNRAMQPLRETTETYDQVLWLNDGIFCADGILQILAHSMPKEKGGLGADAVCGMDYDVPTGWTEIAKGNGSCAFYDAWVSHNMTGHRFMKDKPIVRVGEKRLDEGKPFQVFSCWNGMVAFSADIFQKEHIMFRSSREELNECRASESELIFRDMWTIGRGNIAVSPLAASAYNQANFSHCAIDRQPAQFEIGTVVQWKPAPKRVQCCPLQPNNDFVNFTQCFEENWNRFGENVPHLVTSAFASRVNDENHPVKGEQMAKENGMPSSAEALVPTGRTDIAQDKLKDNFNRFAENAPRLATATVVSRVNDENHPVKDGQMAEEVGMHLDAEVLVPTGRKDITQNEPTWRLAVWSALAAFVVIGFVGIANGSVASGGVYVAVGFWTIMATLMNVFNKECVLLLRCPFTLVSIQMLVAVVLFARSSRDAKKICEWRWCMLSALYGCMLCSNMFAFAHLSATSLLVLRSSLLPFTVLLEKVILPSSAPVSASMLAAVGVAASGTILYCGFAPGGHAISSTGLFWVLINCVATVTHQTLEQTLLSSDMRAFEAMTLINNAVPLVPIAVLAWGTGETRHWSEFRHLLQSPSSIAVLFGSGIVGLCSSQSRILVQKVAAATSIVLAQTASKMLIIAAATVFFNDHFTWKSFIGCVLSLIGCAAYGMAQQAARQVPLESMPLLPKYITSSKRPPTLKR